MIALNLICTNDLNKNHFSYQTILDFFQELTNEQLNYNNWHTVTFKVDFQDCSHKILNVDGNIFNYINSNLLVVP